jgi:hypothetical protein
MCAYPNNTFKIILSYSLHLELKKKMQMCGQHNQGTKIVLQIKRTKL